MLSASVKVLAALVFSALAASCAMPAGAEETWHAGTGLSVGDSFTYSICEKTCYEVSLDFRAKLVSDGRPVWVVQAQVSDRQHVLLLDPATMDIAPATYDFGLSGSLSRTLLYVSEFAPPHAPKSLEPGAAWGSVHGPVPGTQLAVMARDWIQAGGTMHNVALLQYTVFETSTVAISPDLPFPVSAAVYGIQTAPDPPIAFAFELEGYSRGGQGACPVSGDAVGQPSNK